MADIGTGMPVCEDCERELADEQIHTTHPYIMCEGCYLDLEAERWEHNDPWNKNDRRKFDE